MAFSSGYDLTLGFKFKDGLGKLYIAIAVVWSFFLLCGTTFLVLNRNLPFLRIRNVPLTISAVATLHVYWILCFVAYGLNGYFPCDTEFWIMSIYLPFGIALFHASNSQLLYIAGLQRRYTSNEDLTIKKEKSPTYDRGWKKNLHKLKKLTAINKTMTYIGFGMVAQFICAVLIFFLSRKFNDFGVFGETSKDDPVGRAQCRRGLEWLPSIFWQFFWAWVYAPYLLWKVRNIRDVHAWRMQTMICSIAGLPASPMWLIALYVPRMALVNRYFIPPLWFTPSIFLIEAFMIFVPCCQIVKNRNLRNSTLRILDEWEQSRNGTSLQSDLTETNTTSRLSHKPSVISATSSRKAQSHMYTMVALEKALMTNSTPLLLFAALKDFSGENISFLQHVKDWKDGWRASQRYSAMLRLETISLVSPAELRRQQFKKAVNIYSSFVSLKYSNFPINISSVQLKELQAIFEESAALVNIDPDTSSNAATPFDGWTSNSPDDIERAISKDGLSVTSTAIGTISSNEDALPTTERGRASIINSYEMKNIGDKLPANLSIPESFGPDVFDDSVKSIKYTVLTNTWPKFINAGYANTMERGTAAGRLQERVSGYRSGWTRLLSM